LSQLSMAIEKVSDLRANADDLAAMDEMAAAHHKELGSMYVDVKSELDWDSLERLNGLGLLQFLIARIDGRIVGYFTWILDFDVASKGMLTASQHAWFVRDGHTIVGVRLFDRAIVECKKLGVQFAYFHSTAEGRGSKLSRLLESRGAKLVTQTYMLKVKES
jgi:hypothetical protein